MAHVQNFKSKYYYFMNIEGPQLRQLRIRGIMAMKIEKTKHGRSVAAEA